jgi:hypothetical protein
MAKPWHLISAESRGRSDDVCDKMSTRVSWQCVQRFQRSCRRRDSNCGVGEWSTHRRCVMSPFATATSSGCWFAWADEPQDPVETAELLATTEAKFECGEQLAYAIRLRDSEEVIGNVALYAIDEPKTFGRTGTTFDRSQLRNVEIWHLECGDQPGVYSSVGAVGISG